MVSDVDPSLGAGIGTVSVRQARSGLHRDVCRVHTSSLRSTYVAAVRQDRVPGKVKTGLWEFKTPRLAAELQRR